MAVIRKVKTGKSIRSKKIRTIKSLSLPKGKSIPEDDLEKFSWLVYGERKIGKTSFFSEFADPLFFMFEPGGKGLSIKQVAIDSWETFKEYISLLEDNPNYCRTVIIDTGQKCYEKCYEYVLDELGIDDPKDKGWGAGWKAISHEFEVVHNRLFKLDLGIGVTAHSEVKEITSAGGFTRHKLSVQLGAQAFKHYLGILDIIGYYQFNKDGDRILTIRGDADIDAGTRTKGKFLYTNGEQIKDIDMGNSEVEAYKNMCNAFNNKLKKKGGDNEKRLKFKRRIK